MTDALATAILKHEKQLTNSSGSEDETSKTKAAVIQSLADNMAAGLSSPLPNYAQGGLTTLQTVVGLITRGKVFPYDTNSFPGKETHELLKHNPDYVTIMAAMHLSQRQAKQLDFDKLALHRVKEIIASRKDFQSYVKVLLAGKLPKSPIPGIERINRSTLAQLDKYPQEKQACLDRQTKWDIEEEEAKAAAKAATRSASPTDGEAAQPVKKRARRGGKKAKKGKGKAPAADADETAAEGDEREAMTSDAAPARDDLAVAFEALPVPREIVRCPDIDWEKYGIVGSGLDRLHEAALRNPVAQPLPDGSGPILPSRRGENGLLAAAYDPSKDTLE